MSRAPPPADLFRVLDVAMAHADGVDAVTATRLSACCSEFHARRDSLFASATEVAVFGDERLDAVVRKFPNARAVELGSCDDVDDQLALAAPFMTNATRLALTDCEALTDRGLRALRPLANLETLRILGADFSGETDAGVSCVGISALAPLTKLTALQLSVCDVTDGYLDSLSALPNLTELGLDFSQVTDRGMPALARMTSLDSVGLYESYVTDDGVRLLQSLPALRTLEVSYTGQGAEGLAGLTNLTDLTMRWRDASGHLSSLSGLTKLRRLDLECEDLADEDLKDLAPLADLEWLRLKGSRAITERGVAGLAGLPKLTVVFL